MKIFQAEKDGGTQASNFRCKQVDFPFRNRVLQAQFMRFAAKERKFG